MNKNCYLKKLIFFQKACILVLILIFYAVQATAGDSDLDQKNLNEMVQEKKITGTVRDNSGNPIPGATVVIKGTNNGIATDSNGQFTINNIFPNEVIVFSFVGMKTIEIKVGNQNNINAVLSDEAIGLDEIVAVGYGTQKKATLTGAVSAVKSEELVATKNENVVNMMTGKLPGVRVWQKSSEPGNFDRTSFDIRGFGSPLIVIDGVPQGNDQFNRIDPNEIDNISVLKDGSAAIYGVRAANGVILVTTKQGGGNGKFQINYQYNQGLQNFLYMPDNVNATDYMTLSNEAKKRSFAGNFFAQSTPSFLEPDFALYESGQRTSTDWAKGVLKDASSQQQHNVSINGESDKVKYFFNLGYIEQGGILRTDDINYDRWNIRSNNTITITKRLRAQVNLSAYMDNKSQPEKDMWTIFKSAWNTVPTAQVYANNNPDYYDYENRHDNPVAWSSSDVTGTRSNKKRDFQAQGSLEYDIPGVDGLKAKGMYNFHFNNSTQYDYNHAYYLYTYDPQNDNYNGTALSFPSNAQQQYWESTSDLFQTSLNYNHSFLNIHDVSALLLYEESKGKGFSFGARRNVELELPYLAAGVNTEQQGWGSFPFSNSRKSVVGKLNYGYDGKYLMDFSFRYDGSSVFSPKKQWGFFPSASIGWRINNESFIKNNQNLDFIDNLKLRASYGVMGDDGALNYQHVAGYNYPSDGYIFNELYTSGVSSRGMTNANLTWSTAKTTDIGFDFDFWKGKLGGSLDVFVRNRDGLFGTPTGQFPGTIGVGLPQENLNSDRTFGYELALTHRNKVGKVSYFINPNISLTRTETRFIEQSPFSNSYDQWRNSQQNRYTGIWWGQTYDGQFQGYDQIQTYAINTGGGNQNVVPGDYYYEDWNGDGFIDNGDIKPIGVYSMPMINFGGTVGAEWKGLDLNMVFQGSTLFFVRYEEQYATPLMYGNGAMTRFLDRWHTVNVSDDIFNPNTQWVKGYYSTTGSPQEDGSRAVQDASYLRLKSIELGYSIPKNIIKPMGIESLRVYVNGYNLLTFTGLENYDPERPGQSYNDDWNNSQGGYYYPNNKTYNCGVKITF